MTSEKNQLIINEPILDKSRLTCPYNLGNEIFTNSYDFPKNIPERIINDPITKKICNLVAITTSFGLFSVDYFTDLICNFPLKKSEIDFFEKLIYQGFGEFRYVNKIPITTRTTIKSSKIDENERYNTCQNYKNSPLLLNGGGKDGSVSAYLLNKCDIPFTWMQRGDSVAQANVVNAWDKPVIIVNRNLDPNRSNRKYSGHRPMSAGIAMLAVLTAHVYGHRDIIASNETSANEGNAKIDGFALNHQYSKSLEFETDFQALLTNAEINIRYFSLLRSLHELQIAALATNLTEKQLSSITSCNNGTKNGYWCMKCAKCAFVALVFTAVNHSIVKRTWGQEDIINTNALQPYFKELLDTSITKPLECVGTLDECQLSAKIIVENKNNLLYIDQKTYELLNTYAKESTLQKHDFWTKYSKSLVPDKYSPVIKLIKKSLSDFSKSI